MLVLKRHYQFWIAILALHKIGAVAIPATYLLQEHDYEYRYNAAEVDAILCSVDGDIADRAENGAKNAIKVSTPEKLFLNTRISISQVSVWILALALIPGLCNLLIPPVMKIYNKKFSSKTEKPASQNNIISPLPAAAKITPPRIYASQNGNMRV